MGRDLKPAPTRRPLPHASIYQAENGASPQAAAAEVDPLRARGSARVGGHQAAAIKGSPGRAKGDRPRAKQRMDGPPHLRDQAVGVAEIREHLRPRPPPTILLDVAWRQEEGRAAEIVNRPDGALLLPQGMGGKEARVDVQSRHPHRPRHRGPEEDNPPFAAAFLLPPHAAPGAYAPPLVEPPVTPADHRP